MLVILVNILLCCICMVYDGAYVMWVSLRVALKTHGHDTLLKRPAQNEWEHSSESDWWEIHSKKVYYISNQTSNETVIRGFSRSFMSDTINLVIWRLTSDLMIEWFMRFILLTSDKVPTYSEWWHFQSVKYEIDIRSKPVK